MSQMQHFRDYIFEDRQVFCYLIYTSQSSPMTFLGWKFREWPVHRENLEITSLENLYVYDS